MAKFTAPENWKSDERWFDRAGRGQREAFVKQFCKNTFTCYGNTCVVISYPRNDGKDVTVFDMDSGDVFELPIEDAFLCKQTRPTHRSDYEWSGVQNSRVCVEAEDISILLFEED